MSACHSVTWVMRIKYYKSVVLKCFNCLTVIIVNSKFLLKIHFKFMYAKIMKKLGQTLLTTVNIATMAQKISKDYPITRNIVVQM